MLLTVNEFSIALLIITGIVVFATGSVVPLIPSALVLGMIFYANKELSKKRKSR